MPNDQLYSINHGGTGADFGGSPEGGIFSGAPSRDYGQFENPVVGYDENSDQRIRDLIAQYDYGQTAQDFLLYTAIVNKNGQLGVDCDFKTIQAAVDYVQEKFRKKTPESGADAWGGGSGQRAVIYIVADEAKEAYEENVVINTPLAGDADSRALEWVFMSTGRVYDSFGRIGEGNSNTTNGAIIKPASGYSFEYKDAGRNGSGWIHFIGLDIQGSMKLISDLGNELIATFDQTSLETSYAGEALFATGTAGGETYEINARWSFFYGDGPFFAAGTTNAPSLTAEWCTLVIQELVANTVDYLSLHLNHCQIDSGVSGASRRPFYSGSVNDSGDDHEFTMMDCLIDWSMPVGEYFLDLAPVSATTAGGAVRLINNRQKTSFGTGHFARFDGIASLMILGNDLTAGGADGITLEDSIDPSHVMIQGNMLSNYSSTGILQASSASTSGTGVIGPNSYASNGTDFSGLTLAENFEGSGADFWYLPGRSGGQSGYGGTAAGDDLTIESTSHATKGHINLKDKVIIDNNGLTTDDQFYLNAQSATVPQIVFDTGNFMDFDRATNTFGWNSGGSATDLMTYNDGVLTLGDNSVINGLLHLYGNPAGNEGGEIQLHGSGVNNDWVFDNASGSLRWFVGGTVYMQLGTTDWRTRGYGRIGSITAPTNVTAGDMTVLRLKVVDGAFGTGVDFSVTGDGALSGFLRVGSETAPANTTAGDVTIQRLALGVNTAFSGTTAQAANMAYTTVAADFTLSGAKQAFSFSLTVADFAVSTLLNANIAAGDLSLTVTAASGANFPASAFMIMLNNEAIQVTAGFGTDTWTITRARLGTTAAAHTAGDTIRQGAGTDYRGMAFEPVITAYTVGSATTNGITTARMSGARMRGSGAYGQFLGLLLSGMILDASAAASFVSVQNAIGIQAQAVSRVAGGNNPTGTVVLGAGFQVVNSTAANYTLTTQIGLDIESLTTGGTNIGIRNASNSRQTGYATFGAITIPATYTTTGDVGVVRLGFQSAAGTDDANFNLTLVTNPIFTLDSTDTLTFIRSTNLLELKVASTIAWQVGGSSTDPYEELQVADTLAAATSSSFGRMYMFNRNVDILGATPRFMDSASHDSGVTLRARNQIPMPIGSPYTGTPTAITPTTTQGRIGMVYLPAPMMLATIAINVSTASAGANGITRFGIYNENGDLIVSFSSTAGAVLALGVNVLDITDTYLPAGNYYFAVVKGVDYATTQPQFDAMTQTGNTFQAVAGQSVMCGTFVATAGALPDPMGTITSADDSTPFWKLYGTAL